MMAMPLTIAAKCAGGKLHGNGPGFVGLGIDTRTLPAGALFAALPGTQVDGHEFVQAAQQAGAAAALVQRLQPCELPQIVCEDVEQALGRLAKAWRARFSIPVVGITGSNGKTTVKTMLAAILSRRFNCLVNEGNFNNELGLPLTLARLSEQHDIAIIEMGAGKPGDIAYLASLAKPQTGIITMASPAHLQGMGDLMGVVKTKGELFDALPESGLAIINADDPNHSYWRENIAANYLTFGLDEPADLTAAYQSDGEGCELELQSQFGTVGFRMNLLGRHNARNALAAAAAALSLGCNLEDVAVALSEMQPVSGRLCRYQSEAGWVLLEDTYNANPASVRAGIDSLLELSGQPWLVLGDMAELGPDSREIHEEIGRYAEQQGIQRLFSIGELAEAASEAFAGETAHFERHEDLAQALLESLNEEVICLVKGSRGMRMEQIVELLKNGPVTDVDEGASCY